MGSGGLEIWVASTSFQKSNIGWPQQPPTESVSNISEKLDFRWSIPKKRTDIGGLGARDDPTIRLNKKNWWNEAVEVIEASEAAEATEVIEAADVLRPENHYWGLQSHPGIQVQLYFYVLKNRFFLGETMKYHIEF